MSQGSSNMGPVVIHSDVFQGSHYPSPDPSDIWRMSKLGGLKAGLPPQQPAPLVCVVGQAPRPGNLCPTPTLVLGRWACTTEPIF